MTREAGRMAEFLTKKEVMQIVASESREEQLRKSFKPERCDAFAGACTAVRNVAGFKFKKNREAEKQLPDIIDNPVQQIYREDSPAELFDLAIADLGSPAPLLPAPGVPAHKGSTELWGPKVPDFYGKTMRAALETSAQLGVPVECCVVVEDAPAGVEAARRAGMRCIGVGPAHRELPADLCVAALDLLDEDAFDRLLS